MGKKQFKFSCPLLSEEELAAVSVPMRDIKHPTKGIKAIAATHGFFIVPDLLSNEEIHQAQEAMQQDMMELVDQEDIRNNGSPNMTKAWERAAKEGVGAWPTKALQQLGGVNRFQKCGLPHSRFAWYCRRLNNVVAVYEELHGTNELVSSCDNSFVANKSSQQATTNKYWPHVDINDNVAEVRDWDVFQGLVYVWSSHSLRSSTTVIWPSSHKREIFDVYTNDPKTRRAASRDAHFTQMGYLTSELAKKEFKDQYLENARRMVVPAGGGVFWDSRTTHQGWSGGPRLAQPVCWEPTSRRTELARNRKLIMAALGFPSTHFASLGLPHNLVTPELPDATPGQEAEDQDEIVFPLHPTIRSQALKPDVSAMDVWHRMSDIAMDGKLPSETLQFLEDSILDDYKRIL